MKRLLSSLVLLALIGCSGSSSPTETVQNIDGLKQVRNGDKVSFYVGDILLAKVKAHENMTLFDLAEVTAPVKAHDVKKSLNNTLAKKFRLK